MSQFANDSNLFSTAEQQLGVDLETRVREFYELARTNSLVLEPESTKYRSRTALYALGAEAFVRLSTVLTGPLTRVRYVEFVNDSVPQPIEVKTQALNVVTTDAGDFAGVDLTQSSGRYGWILVDGYLPLLAPEVDKYPAYFNLVAGSLVESTPEQSQFVKYLRNDLTHFVPISVETRLLQQELAAQLAKLNQAQAQLTTLAESVRVLQVGQVSLADFEALRNEINLQADSIGAVLTQTRTISLATSAMRDQTLVTLNGIIQERKTVTATADSVTATAATIQQAKLEAQASAAASIETLAEVTTKLTEAGVAAESAITASISAAVNNDASEASALVSTTKAAEANQSAANALSSETVSATYLSQAQSARDVAVSQAGVATTKSAEASQSAANALASEIVSASITPNTRNKDPYLTRWNSATQLASWSPSYANATRVAGFQAQYSARLTPAANQNADQGQLIQFSPGWWVEEMEVTLNAGSLRGVGVHTHSYKDANGTEPTGDFSTTDLWSRVGDGVIGRTYRIITTPRQWTAACVSARIYAIAHWNGFPGLGGDISAANDVTIRFCGIRPATEVEIRDRTTLVPLEATVSSQASAIADSANKLAEARLRIVAAATGGLPAIFEMFSSNLSSSFLALKASQIYFGDNTVFDDATDTLTTTIAASQVNCIAWGLPFGADSDLLQWVGPTGIAVGNRSKANAYFFISITSPRIGGSELVISGGSGQVIVVGYGQIIKKVLAPGASAYFFGTVTIESGGDSGSFYSRILVAEGGTGVYSVVANSFDTQPIGYDEPEATSALTASFTNNTGVTKVFDFIVDAFRTAGSNTGGPVIESRSYLTETYMAPPIS